MYLKKDHIKIATKKYKKKRTKIPLLFFPIKKQKTPKHIKSLVVFPHKKYKNPPKNTTNFVNFWGDF